MRRNPLLCWGLVSVRLHCSKCEAAAELQPVIPKRFAGEWQGQPLPLATLRFNTGKRACYCRPARSVFR